LTPRSCCFLLRDAQENRQQEIADISSGIKALAEKLNGLSFSASEIAKGNVKRTEKLEAPTCANQAAIEQDADLVVCYITELERRRPSGWVFGKWRGGR
jgi:replicative DNA helicase